MSRLLTFFLGSAIALCVSCQGSSHGDSTYLKICLDNMSLFDSAYMEIIQNQSVFGDISKSKLADGSTAITNKMLDEIPQSFSKVRSAFMRVNVKEIIQSNYNIDFIIESELSQLNTNRIVLRYSIENAVSAKIMQDLTSDGYTTVPRLDSLGNGKWFIHLRRSID